MEQRSFEGRVQAGHKENAVEVPFDPLATWGATAESFAPGRRGVPVVCRIGDRAFATHVVRRSRRHWLLLPTGPDGAGSVAVGTLVAVTVGPAALPT